MPMCQEQHRWHSAMSSMSSWSLFQTYTPLILRCHTHTHIELPQKGISKITSRLQNVHKNPDFRLLCVNFLSLAPCTRKWWDSHKHYYCLPAVFSCSSSIRAGLYPHVLLLSPFFCPLLIFIRWTYKEGLSLSWVSIFWPQTPSCSKQACLDSPATTIPAACLTQRRTDEELSEQRRMLQDTTWAFLYRTTNSDPESGGNIQAVCHW